MKKFNVGDEVRIIDDERYGCTNMSNHTEGIVERYSDIRNEFVVNITKCDDNSYIGSTWEYNDCELELIDDENIMDTKLKFKGENKMNKVLELYCEKHLKEIYNKYDELMDKDYSEISIIKEYNELIENFEKQLDDLFIKSENEEVPFEEVTSYNVYKFEPDNDEIKADLFEKYKHAENAEIDELTKLRDEVEAQLSLSDNIDYQLDVLKRYDIINKKTGRVN